MFMMRCHSVRPLFTFHSRDCQMVACSVLYCRTYLFYGCHCNLEVYPSYHSFPRSHIPRNIIKLEETIVFRVIEIITPHKIMWRLPNGICHITYDSQWLQLSLKFSDLWINRNLSRVKRLRVILGYSSRQTHNQSHQ